MSDNQLVCLNCESSPDATGKCPDCGTAAYLAPVADTPALVER